MIDHQTLIIKMVRRTGMPSDRNSIATTDIIEKSLILIKTDIGNHYQDRVYNILSSACVLMVMG